MILPLTKVKNNRKAKSGTLTLPETGKGIKESFHVLRTQIFHLLSTLLYPTVICHNYCWAQIEDEEVLRATELKFLLEKPLLSPSQKLRLKRTRKNSVAAAKGPESDLCFSEINKSAETAHFLRKTARVDIDEETVCDRVNDLFY
ncbi:hypothetical protein RUM43_003906 [Polyplax serrata]|uniref:Uncharacterized protein n=1 Tax=Polyplax serrata TaxID=468196 RepID=A0AAN8SAD6_POLSC